VPGPVTIRRFACAVLAAAAAAVEATLRLHETAAAKRCSTRSRRLIGPGSGGTSRPGPNKVSRRFRRSRGATSSSDDTVRIWEAATGREQRKLEGTGKGIAAVAWNPGGGDFVRSLEHGVKLITCAAFSPDGTRLAMVPLDGTVVLLDSVPATARLPRQEGCSSGASAAVSVAARDTAGSSARAPGRPT
jgi:hypothetical protein